MGVGVSLQTPCVERHYPSTCAAVGPSRSSFLVPEGKGCSLSARLLGASGYAGADLRRLAAGHPDSKVMLAAAETQAGGRLGDLYPSLAAIRAWAPWAATPRRITARSRSRRLNRLGSKPRSRNLLGDVILSVAGPGRTYEASTLPIQGGTCHQMFH